MNTPNERLQKIADFTCHYLKTSYEKRQDKDELNRFLSGLDYRWQHTQRVAQFGKIIAEGEGADVELVVAACLLHDISWFDVQGENSRDHGIVGAEIARPFLASLGYTKEQVENICYSIASHVTVENPETLEANIVSDADNVDRFGPFRILQWCFSDIDDYDKLADKLSERIKRLERYRTNNPLATETGKHLFAEQLHLQILFFSEFVGEKGLTALPQL
jgi:putative nucleotidyltransferase with HDIG domain